MATPDSKERFIGLEWLRFLLGLYVVVYHTLHTYPKEQKFPGLDELTSLGFFATSTFFVLSGFLLAHVYARSGRLRESARSFWTKRLSNLYPLHLFSLLLSILVLLALSHLGIGPELDKATPRFVIYDTNEVLGRTHPELFLHWMSNTELFVNSILQILLLQAWNPYYLTFNAPLWSLSTLMFFYLAFPFVAPRLMRSRHKWKVLALVWLVYLIPPALVVASESYGIPWTGLLHRNPLLRLPEFLGGILATGCSAATATVAWCRDAACWPRWWRWWWRPSWWPTTCSPRAPNIGTSCCTTACCCRPSCCWCAFVRCPPTEERFRPPLVAAPGGRLAVAVRPACADVHPVLP